MTSSTPANGGPVDPGREGRPSRTRGTGDLPGAAGDGAEAATEADRFAAIADQAIGLRARGALAATPPSAADPEPADLVRYAAGCLDGRARAEVEAWLGRSRWAYERLVALKNTYDPTNLFRLNQNIKPTV